MPQHGMFVGFIGSIINTVMVNASLADVEAKLKEVDKANDAASKRWQEVLSSPPAASYKAKRALEDWEQTKLIVDMENLLGLVAAIGLAQQQVLVALLGAAKALNKK